MTWKNMRIRWWREEIRIKKPVQMCEYVCWANSHTYNPEVYSKPISTEFPYHFTFIPFVFDGLLHDSTKTFQFSFHSQFDGFVFTRNVYKACEVYRLYPNIHFTVTWRTDRTQLRTSILWKSAVVKDRERELYCDLGENERDKKFSHGEFVSFSLEQRNGFYSTYLYKMWLCIKSSHYSLKFTHTWSSASWSDDMTHSHSSNPNFGKLQNKLCV